jgi:hypothetical protein
LVPDGGSGGKGHQKWLASIEVTKITESWLFFPRVKKIWRQDGGMEHNTRKTFPERSQRDYWEGVNHQVNK